MEKYESKINRAKELVKTTRHIALATVNIDGTPHNSPVRFLYDEAFENVYWGSNTEALHSQNVLRTGQLFGVLFDRIESGGLYIQCEGGHILGGKELEVGLNIHNSFRISEGGQPIKLSYYTGGSEQKMWSAKIKNLWVNYPIRDENGFILRDERVEIDKKYLI